MVDWYDPSTIENDEELDIRFNLEKGLVKKKSGLINIIAIIVYYLQFVSPIILYARWKKAKGDFKNDDWFPMWLSEGWIYFKFISLIVVLLIIGPYAHARSVYSLFILLFPLWFLLDNLTALGRDLILAPNLHKGKIYVYDFQRWLVLTLFGAFEVILCFAVLVLFCCDHFKGFSSHIIINSIYFSAVTFCTLGYGDISPKEGKIVGQLIVMTELFYFFIFLVIKIPIAISMFKVEIINTSDEK